MTERTTKVKNMSSVEANDEQLPGVILRGAPSEKSNEILTSAALSFIVDLERRFGARRRELVEERARRQQKLDAGERPTFSKQTDQIRKDSWTVATLPSDLLDRRVEITGPVDRKMIINALNSGANVFMADFEDSNAPTWSNLIDGQLNLRDAVRRAISYDDPKTGKHYELNQKVAVLMVRPRGWHLPEKHLLVDGLPMSGSLFDFGLYFWHNAKELIARGSGPYFYLPKLEGHLEARLWNDIFLYAQQSIGLKRGTIKATVLIETILASFEMDEILYELREHSAGLNCGRWDYIFSFIKKFSADPSIIFPDRMQLTMTTHFMRSYSKLLIKTCHRREVHGIGGMAAFIPIKNDSAANQVAMDQVHADKEREVSDGHDGTWVAHPGLVALAREVFDKHMPQSNQIAMKLEDTEITGTDLLMPVSGEITERGLRQNIAVGIGYLESWLKGIGCVPLFNLMEDAATAEISRAQLWQWVHHNAHLSDGRTVTWELFQSIVEEELCKIREAQGNAQFEASKYREAASLLCGLVQSKTFVEFLTLAAYDQLNSN
jgi:malate synthase